jgi:hypothetical protein
MDYPPGFLLRWQAIKTGRYGPDTLPQDEGKESGDIGR